MNPDGGIWPSIIIILLTAILGAFLMVGDAAITNLNEGKLKKLLEALQSQPIEAYIAEEYSTVFPAF